MSETESDVANLPVAAATLDLSAALGADSAALVRDQLPAAISAAGGEVLFEMSPPEDENVSWVAAVAFGEGDTRRLAIVSLAAEGDVAKVEPAEECELAVAGIVKSFAGVMEHLRMAA